jgi:hypothetical protein
MKTAFLLLATLLLVLSGCGTKPPCNASTCEGCCDATGVCRLGSTNDACGAKGGTCAVCVSGCTSGACAVVDAGVVPDAGSCEASTSSPTGRSDFGGAWDAVGNQLVVFGGDPGVAVNCQGRPAFSDETWFYSPGCNTWRLSTEVGPSPRSRHATAFDTKRRRLIVFGGRYRAGASGLYTTYNDTHALRFEADGTHLWSPLTTLGAPPPPLSSATAVYDPTGDRFIVFGGNTSNDGGTFVPNGRVFALALTDNTWTELVPTAGVPPARLFHGMVLDLPRNRLVAFSGGDANAFLGPFFTDVVAFDLSTRAWTTLALAGTKPLGRIRPAMAADPDRNRILVFGGHDDGQLGETNELWAINLAANRWDRVRTGDTLLTAGNGFCDFPSNFTTADLMSPERREGHVFVNAGANGFLMFGGRSDCGTVNDVWKLDPVKAEWEVLKQAFSGLSCERSGKTNCSKLCF